MKRHFFTKNLFLCLFMLGTTALFAQKTVKGTIKDSEGAAMIGASILEKNTRNGTVTNADGAFELSVADNATLVISYIGMMTQELSASGDLNITMSEDRNQLSDVVVTTSRQPIRKLEATTTVSIISPKQLQIRKPESINDAIAGTPGIFINTSQGRRGGIITRGFPDGNPLGGLVYTGILLDGLPTFGTTGKSPDLGFGFDLNVDRVEVVRGATSTLFGRSSAAGAVNIITRTGGTKHSATVRTTYFNNILDTVGQNDFNYRVDINLNGPITKNLRYNVGGWLLDDRGFRNTGYKDKGFQFRGNIDYLMSKGKIRLYGLFSDFNFQNLTDVAINPTNWKLAPGWKNTDTYQPIRFTSLTYKVYETASKRNVKDAAGNEISRNLGDAMAGGVYTQGGHFGANIDYSLPGGITLENRFRYQRLKNGTKYGFALPSFYAQALVSRLYLDGDSDDEDMMNELRLKKTITSGNSTHNISVGGYFSQMHLLPTTYSYLYGSTTDPNNIKLSNAFAAAAPAPTTGSITRRGDYKETVTAGFIGDEMKFGQKLSVNVGARYDALKMDMKETKIPFDTTLIRNENFSDWSASLGANYLLTPVSAIYGNITRAFRMPDYSAFTSLERSADKKSFLRAPTGIEKNEIVFNTEIGYRNTWQALSFDIAAFFTNIDNRLASIFENGILVSKPLGQNQIKGAEISAVLRPSVMPGFSLRASYTFQDGRFADFSIPVSRAANGTLNVNPAGNLYGNTLVLDGQDAQKRDNYKIDLKGNKIPGIPTHIFNAGIDYEHKYFGVNISGNVNKGRFADATNTIDLGTLSVVDAGIYGKIPMKGTHEVQIGIQSRNLFNATGLQNIAGVSDTDGALAQWQRTPTFANLYAHGYVQLPRRFMVTLTYKF
jgi:iron complex outermembrane recepter protein